MLAVTVPSVMPLTATLYVVGPPVTTTVLVPPAVPPIVTSLLVKPVTGSLNTAVKLMGDAFVGSFWPAAWLIVTVGGVVSYVTLLSVLLEAVLPFPAKSVAPPAPMLAVTVPSVIPLAATLYVVGPPVTTTVLVPPAVPPIVTSLLVKPVTGSLNTAVKLMGELLVGSFWPAAWLIVTVGGGMSYVTLLSVLLEAVLPFPAKSVAPPAPMLAVTVPSVIPLTATLYVVGPPVTTTVLVPPAVPPIVTSLLVKPVTGSLNTAVKLMGELLVGSFWPAAWLIVTVGGVMSYVTLLSVLLEAVLPFPAKSVAPPAPMLAVTVPSVIPLTATLYVVGPPVTTTVLVPPAVSG